MKDSTRPSWRELLLQVNATARLALWILILVVWAVSRG
jgi:hypothetical protein